MSVLLHLSSQCESYCPKSFRDVKMTNYYLSTKEIKINFDSIKVFFSSIKAIAQMQFLSIETFSALNKHQTILNAAIAMKSLTVSFCI